MRRGRLVRVVAAGGEGRAVVAEAEFGLGLVEAVDVEAVGVEVRDEVVGRAQEDNRLVACVGADFEDALKYLQRGKDSRGVTVRRHTLSRLLSGWRGFNFVTSTPRARLTV